MIAFVGSSMASNEAQKGLLSTEKSQISSPAKIEINPCFETVMKTMDLVEADMGIINDIVEYNTLYQYYIGSCELGLINFD